MFVIDMAVMKLSPQSEIDINITSSQNVTQLEVINVTHTHKSFVEFVNEVNNSCRYRFEEDFTT